MKPMLAATMSPENIGNLRYPMIASPKLDGIRCLTAADGTPMSRKFIEIPNVFVQDVFKANWQRMNVDMSLMDGELMIPGADFNAVQSAIMSTDKNTYFEYHVFDIATVVEPFRDRFARLKRKEPHLPLWVKIVEQWEITCPVDLIAAEEYCVQQGYEGIMLRDPSALYKLGRATEKSGELLKWKRWFDTEGVVTGFVEMMRNQNEATKDALGHTKRSSAKAGKVPAGVLGALVVAFGDGEGGSVEVGTGFTAAQRAELWARRDELPGRVIQFAYQELSKKGVPRFPTFRGFRED